MKTDIICLFVTVIHLVIAIVVAIGGKFEIALSCMIISALFCVLAHLAYIIRYLRGMTEFFADAIEHKTAANEHDGDSAGNFPVKSDCAGTIAQKDSEQRLCKKIYRAVHMVGGCDASCDYDKGYDDGVSAALEAITMLTGADAHCLDEEDDDEP